jgi:AraC-like DNA-binding protein
MEQMQSHFARLVRSHEAELAEPRTDFLAELQYAPLARVVLSSAAVEVSVMVRAQPKNTYLVFGAIGRPLHMQIDRRSTVIPVGMIGVVPPGIPYRLYLPRGGCRTLMLEIEPGFLESIIAEEIHGDVNGPVRFADDAAAHGEGERHFLELLKHMRDELAQGAPQCRSGSYVARLEQLLASALIHATPHNYSDRLHTVNDAAEPRFVRRAVDFIHAYAGEQITLKAIAGIAAVSPRTLVRGFHKYKDCAPASYLRTVRLDRSRQELLSSVPEDTSVTGVAAKWGFSNVGRFARWYRERFGENPVDTLRRKART